jgi:hypothetical protein
MVKKNRPSGTARRITQKTSRTQRFPLRQIRLVFYIIWFKLSKSLLMDTP